MGSDGSGGIPRPPRRRRPPAPELSEEPALVEEITLLGDLVVEANKHTGQLDREVVDRVLRSSLPEVPQLPPPPRS